MKFKTVLGTSVMTLAAIAIAYPATAQPIPPASVNACTQRVAEAMVVATRDIELTGGGPVDALKGTQTLFFRNRVTGQTAECKVNHIDAYVLSVTVSPQVRPPQPTPPIAPVPPIAPIPPNPPVPAASINACIQRTAEDMVVAGRDIEFVSAGPMEGNTGIRTLSMRNRVTGQTAKCRVNTRTNTVISVTTSPQPRPPQPQPVPPGNSSTSGLPVPPNDPTARKCQDVVANKIRGSFGGVQTLSFLPETTRRYFVSNAAESIRGEGQFSQRSKMFHRFNYNCNVNIRNGQVTGTTYTIIR